VIKIKSIFAQVYSILFTQLKIKNGTLIKSYFNNKFKKQFRKWLWEKVREPNIQKIYNLNYLIEHLGEDNDLDIVLDNWK
jgi:hypothetical protein